MPEMTKSSPKKKTAKKTKKKVSKKAKSTGVVETRGRPSLFSDEIFNKIVEMYTEGKTEDQVAEIIGVHVETIRRWKREKEGFRWASAEAKMIADEMVEASLFKKAIGFNYFEEQATRDGVQALQKYAQPDPRAQIFWLKNRRSADWKDRVEVEHKSNHSIFLDTGDEEEDIPV